MLAVKRINHNAAICEDGSGRQIIALGRGIGFGDLPREIDLADIQRTFYGIDPKYLPFIDEVDPQVLEFAAQMADLVRQHVSYEVSPNLPVTLADHIQFAIKRAREHLVIPLAFDEDVEQNHPIEYRIGELAVRGIRKTFNVRLPRSEIAGIALSIVNAMTAPSERTAERAHTVEQALDAAISSVESHTGTPLDRSSFACARFITHVRYLLQRIEAHEPLDTRNSSLLPTLAVDYPEATQCARDIAAQIESTWETALTDDELVYLIIHINRILAHESTEGHADSVTE